MLTFVSAVASLMATSLEPPAAPDPCAGQHTCQHATAAQLFAVADALAAQGDLAGAEQILEALTEDPHLELRSEARFRLAAVREQRGDLEGAIGALRALLAEQPSANPVRLELSRLLALKGDDSGARRELRRAAAGGLPPDVARTVGRFSMALNSRKRRGASLDLAIAPDSNINRSTSDKFIDTVIAPFELDPDARGQSGIGFSVGGEAFSRDGILGATLLTRAGLHGDFFDKARFDDIQLTLNSGPEIVTRSGRIRPSLTHERRWYGGHPYSIGYGASLSWLTTPSPTSQLELNASTVRQSIHGNALLDGCRSTLSATYDRAFTPQTSARIGLRALVLDATAKPESVHEGGGDVLVAHDFGVATIFGQAGYTKTRGQAPLALFGKTRDDNRIDLGAGVIAHRIQFRGFAPLVRVIYTNSQSNIALYDFRRTRVELGLSREF